jgi:phosphatidylglycerol---prolipoprotein diacylglyceryl transferase
MPSREAFRIGPFKIGNFTIDIPVYWYGIMIMLGVIAASFVSYQEARRRKEDPEHVWQMFPWVLVSGIVGARLGFILVNIGNAPYSQDPSRIFAIWEGGLSIQGAVIGGAIAVILYCRRYGLSFFTWGDIIAPGLALAQAIGRWGNYFNQEAFGRPTTLPWGIPISVQRQREVAGQEFGPDTRFHPTFAYEMIWDLLNFGLLMWLGRQKRIRLLEGDLMWVYLVVYSVGRFGIEAIRVDSATVGGIPAPQIVAILTIVLAWTMFLIRHRPGSNVPVSETNLPEGALASGRPSQRTGAGVRSAPASPRPTSTRLRRVPAIEVAASESTDAAGSPEAREPEVRSRHTTSTPEPSPGGSQSG